MSVCVCVWYESLEKLNWQRTRTIFYKNSACAFGACFSFLCIYGVISCWATASQSSKHLDQEPQHTQQQRFSLFFFFFSMLGWLWGCSRYLAVTQFCVYVCQEVWKENKQANWGRLVISFFFFLFRLCDRFISRIFFIHSACRQSAARNHAPHLHIQQQEPLSRCSFCF